MYFLGKGRVLWFQLLFREFILWSKIRIRLLAQIYCFSLLICYSYSFLFHALMLVTLLEEAKAPLNDTGKDYKLNLKFVMNLSFWFARGFDFVLSLDVTIPLLTQVMRIDWIGSFWEVEFDMLKSMKFGNLVGLFSSSKRFDRVYQGWFI